MVEDERRRRKRKRKKKKKKKKKRKTTKKKKTKRKSSTPPPAYICRGTIRQHSNSTLAGLRQLFPLCQTTRQNHSTGLQQPAACPSQKGVEHEMMTTTTTIVCRLSYSPQQMMLLMMMIALFAPAETDLACLALFSTLRRHAVPP